MIKLGKGGIAAAMLPIFLSCAHAAYVDVHAVPWQHDRSGQMVTVRVSAGIDKGDLDLIREKLKLAADRGQVVVALELDSWGGDGDTGILLADFVYHNKKLKVFIGDRCWSACSYAALVALGHGNLLVGPYAKLGVHQVVDNDTHFANIAWTKMAARILRKYGAPQQVLDAMVGQPPSGLVYYGAAELEAMGAVGIGKEWSWSSLFQ